MRIVLAEEMRNLDRMAEEEIGIPGLVLMENAGRAVADRAEEMLEGCPGRHVVIFAGKGNNGGDGAGAGRWLMNRGARVTLVLAGLVDDLSGSAADEMQYYLSCNGKVLELPVLEGPEDIREIRGLAREADLIVDALLGTGFSGELRPLYTELCKAINGSGRPVLAVDIPTGVNADDGSADLHAVTADMTVTMALPKQGLYLCPGMELAGEVDVADIGMPLPMLLDPAGDRWLITGEMVANLLPIRPRNMHKGDAGRVVTIAGSYGYLGAAELASRSAVLSGAGLVTLLTPQVVRSMLAVKLTEVMVKALPSDNSGILQDGAVEEAASLAASADAVAIGPGLGTSEETARLIREILLHTEKTCVVDADALTALQDHTDILLHMVGERVLTPHPGEMARLTGLSVAEIEADRVEVAREYAEKWQSVVVLKGVPTVVALPGGESYLNVNGNPSMATGGSGDVLTGLIAALAAQGMEAADAAVAGVYLHGLAGDLAAEGRTGISAGQLLEAIPRARYLVEHGSDRE